MVFMSLVRTVRAVINICRNPVKLTQCIWDELDAFDTRIDNVEGGIVDEGSIDTAELADGAVETDKIADAAVNTDKIAVFSSEEQTGTGDAQSIAHGLGAEPSTVLILLSTVGTDGASYTFTKGSANVNVTATSGAKYYVVAIA